MKNIIYYICSLLSTKGYKLFNKIILVGNLTRDIEVRFSSSNLAIANTGIATNKKFKNQMGEEKEEIMFIDITFFGRTAEIANQYLKKGSKVMIEGRLKLDQWTDKSGAKRSKHSVTVESMQMLGGKEESKSMTQVPIYGQKEHQSKVDLSQKNEFSFEEEDFPF